MKIIDKDRTMNENSGGLSIMSLHIQFLKYYIGCGWNVWVIGYMTQLSQGIICMGEDRIKIERKTAFDKLPLSERIRGIIVEIILECPRCREEVYMIEHESGKCSYCGLEYYPFDRCSSDYSDIVGQNMNRLMKMANYIQIRSSLS